MPLFAPSTMISLGWNDNPCRDHCHKVLLIMRRHLPLLFFSKSLGLIMVSRAVTGLLRRGWSAILVNLSASDEAGYGNNSAPICSTMDDDPFALGLPFRLMIFHCPAVTLK